MGAAVVVVVGATVVLVVVAGPDWPWNVTASDSVCDCTSCSWPVRNDVFVEDSAGAAEGLDAPAVMVTSAIGTATAPRAATLVVRARRARRGEPVVLGGLLPDMLGFLQLGLGRASNGLGRSTDHCAPAAGRELAAGELQNGNPELTRNCNIQLCDLRHKVV